MSIIQRVQVTCRVLWKTRSSAQSTSATNTNESIKWWVIWSIWNCMNIWDVVVVLERGVFTLKLELDADDAIFNLGTTTVCFHVRGTLNELETVTLVLVEIGRA